MATITSLGLNKNKLDYSREHNHSIDSNFFKDNQTESSNKLHYSKKHYSSQFDHNREEEEEEEKVICHYPTHNHLINQKESLQLIDDSLNAKKFFPSVQIEIGNLRTNGDIDKLISAKTEELNTELSTFVLVFLKRKISEIIYKDYQKTHSEDEDFKSEHQLIESAEKNESKIKEDIGNDNKCDDNDDISALNQLKYLHEKFASSSSSFILLLDFAFESFFNKDNSVEPSFEKEINDLMLNDLSSDNKSNIERNSQLNEQQQPSQFIVSLKNELKQHTHTNTNTNQSTSVPSHSMKVNNDNCHQCEKKLKEQFDIISQVELSSPFVSNQNDLFILSMINNNNNNNMYSFNSSDESSIMLSPQRSLIHQHEQTQSDISDYKQKDEDSFTKETRIKIEELILKRTFNKIDDFHQPSYSKKVSRECTSCKKPFFSKPDQTWRTRCYYCQMEFKRVCNEGGNTNQRKEIAITNPYVLNTKPTKVTQSGKVKQVCITCRQIFVVPISLLRKRKRCFTCYKDFNEYN